ncbi:MAG TPA: universal stress protein [Gaiellaceae bacterium]|nr:universal stress protein [Gaiellaceae bacterium]
MKILGAIDNSAAARPVLAVASALADLLAVEVEALHARENGEHNARAAAAAAGVPLRSTTKPVVAALVEAGRLPEVVCLVLGARGVDAGRRPAGHVALELVLALPKPVVVVPPNAPMRGELRRILVPLNGRGTTAAALAETLMLASRRELELIVLHVYDQASIPLFSDQRHHEVESWAQEFLRRHCPYPERVRLEVRIGIPAENVLQVAEEMNADMITLGWSQDLSPGHAAVVREVLERSRIPVLLVPTVVEVGFGKEPAGGAAAANRPSTDERVPVLGNTGIEEGPVKLRDVLTPGDRRR